MTHPNPQQGFTLLELMITLAIAAILLALAIPNFQSTMAKSQLSSQTNNFLASMAIARNLAVKNNLRAQMCASKNGTACNGVNWSDGWIVWSDANRDDVVDPNEISNVSAAPNGLKITGRSPPVKRTLNFGSDGLLSGLAGTITVCSNALPTGQNARNIVMNITGRASVKQPTTPINAGACP